MIIEATLDTQTTAAVSSPSNMHIREPQDITKRKSDIERVSRGSPPSQRLNHNFGGLSSVGRLGVTNRNPAENSTTAPTPTAAENSTPPTQTIRALGHRRCQHSGVRHHSGICVRACIGKGVKETNTLHLRHASPVQNSVDRKNRTARVRAVPKKGW